MFKGGNPPPPPPKKKIHYNNVSNVFKVNSKDTRTTSGASVVNFKHRSHFILLLINIAGFESINAGWA